MKKRRGISLIVLIVTIIVMIILAGVVMLTLNKNNPIEGAKEAKFKQDVSNFRGELSLTISKEYIDLQGNRTTTINATSYDDIKKSIPSFTSEYENKLVIENDKLMYIKNNLNENEVKWLKDIEISQKLVIPDEWQHSIASITEDGVPIPKGFTYVTGTKNTGTVIQDEKGNQFVWIPATADTYVRDLSFPAYDRQGVHSSGEDTGINEDDSVEDESADIIKYGGFYIGRFEAGVPDGQTEIDGISNENSDKEGVPVCKQGAIVWRGIGYNNAKLSAEQMINNEYVKTGLLTGKAWDTTCHFLEDVVDITDSRTYGNYFNSAFPANMEGCGEKQVAGYSDKWMVKNIYDLAGNSDEWTSEIFGSNNHHTIRGGAYYPAVGGPVSLRDIYEWEYSDQYITAGFRPRLYIK